MCQSDLARPIPPLSGGRTSIREIRIVPGPTKDDRPPMVVAMNWVSQITTIGLEMSLPALGGNWLDNRWGTSPWLVCVGAVIGFALGMWHLMQLARTSSNTPTRPKQKQDE